MKTKLLKKLRKEANKKYKVVDMEAYYPDYIRNVKLKDGTVLYSIIDEYGYDALTDNVRDTQSSISQNPEWFKKKLRFLKRWYICSRIDEIKRAYNFKDKQSLIDQLNS